MSELKLQTIGGSTKTITILPAWVERVSSGLRVGNAAAAYTVPLVYRAVAIRANSLCQVPYILTSGGKEIEDWPMKTDVRDLLWRTEAALLLRGASFWLKGGSSRIPEVSWLNPFSMKVKLLDQTDEGAVLQFRQEVGGKTYGPWSEDQIVYIKEFHPTDDVNPGIAAADVALANAQLYDYTVRFAGQFFKDGAMPAVVVGLPETSSPQDAAHAEKFFKRMIVGVQNAFRVLAVRGEMKAEILTPPMKDLVLPDLLAEARRQIAWAFGLPQTMLDDAANYATATQHDLQFWQQTVIPRCWKVQAAINDQLFDGTPYRIEFTPDEMDVFQEDENARASSLGSLVNAGLDLDIALEVLGYDLDDGQWARVREAMAKKEQAADDLRDRLAASRPNQQGDAGGDDDGPPAPAGGSDDGSKRRELALWERKSLRALARGASPRVFWEPEAVPPAVAGAIDGMLARCTTPAAVRSVFRSAVAESGGAWR